MPEQLEGLVAIVTGGSRGLGAEIARTLSKAGAKVAVLARDTEKGEQAAAAIRAQGGEALFVSADIADEDSGRTAVAKVRAAFGAVNLLVNNAGVTPSSLGGAAGSAADIDLKLWKRYLDVNVTGTLLMSRHAFPHMKEAGYGSIVNINSMAGEFAPPNDVGYAASKAAMTGLTKSMAIDFGPTTRVNQIFAGFVPNPDNPRHQAKLADPVMRRTMIDTVRVGRVGLASDIANACLFLCSRESGFISGHSLAVDGGAHIIARPMSGSTQLGGMGADATTATGKR